MSTGISSSDDPLSSLGERRIIDEMIGPTFSSTQAVIRGIGDDTAALRSTAGHELLVTTDPCPTPVISLLGDPDMWHWGRLTYVISLSDLAASGAMPLGMVVSTIMPETMRISEYARYLDSLEHHAQLWDCPIVGGNIKDGSEFSSCSTAIGESPPGATMTRTGANPGDKICVVGSVGHFWSAVLSRMHAWTDLERKHHTAFQKALLEPTPCLREGQMLAASRKVTACIDASDGLGAALELLAASNRVDAVVDGLSNTIEDCVRDVASRANVDPLAVAMSWGDWQLVFTAPEGEAEQLIRLVSELGSPCRVVGHVGAASDGRLLYADHYGGVALPIRSFASERFRRSSYFTHGLESYVQLLRLGPYLSESHTDIARTTSR